MPNTNTLDRLVERRHPAYDENLEHWEFLESCYRSDRTWFESNIHKYYKEGPSNYAERVKRAYRFNHSREVVDLVNKYLFRVKVIRNEEDAPDCLVSFWKDTTGTGVDIQQFAKNLSTKTSTSGRHWVVVDSTVRDGQIVSMADEKKNKQRVYAYTVSPKDALDMSFDNQGNLNWILIREYHRSDEDPFLTESDNVELHERYRLWTRDEWYLYEAKTTKAASLYRKPTKVIEETAKGTHGLGIVPVTWCDHMESDELYTTPSLIADIAYLDRATANYASNLDAIIQDQTFSQLAIPAQNLMPGSEGEDAIRGMGTKQIFTYDGENGQIPMYLSPDAAQGELIMGAIQKLINEIYHTIGMAGERTKQDNAVGTDNSSGVAKAYDFERVNAMLVSKANSLDKFERRLSRIVCEYSGQTLDNQKDDFIKYPDDFDTRGLSGEFDVAVNLKALDMPQLIRSEHGKKLVEELFPRASDRLKGELATALKEWPEDPYVAAERMAKAVSTEKPEDTGKGGTNRAPTKTGDGGIRRESRQGQVTDKTK